MLTIALRPRPGVRGVRDAGRPRADRRAIIVVLACVLGLQTADTASIGALAVELERDLGISNTELGLLVTVSALVGAAATVPAGVLADRGHRVRLLAWTTLLWPVAMVASALAPGYGALLGTRLALGVVTAAAGPLVASLTGDYFPRRERAGVLGFIQAGELVGAGLGFLIVGNAAAVLGWRGAIALLGAFAFALPVMIIRVLREPPRRAGRAGARPAQDDDLAEQVRRAGVAPRTGVRLPPGDPARMSLGRAVRYVLSVPTNVVLITASALGYFFLTGVQTFGVQYGRDRFGLGQAQASTLLVAIGAGALAGVLVGGRIADAGLHRGRLAARITVPGIAMLAAAAVFLPGLRTDELAIAIPIFAVAVAFLAATNPPLDAARLDVVHGALWGRAESVRVVPRTALVAFAPLCFGLITDALGGGHAHLRVPQSSPRSADGGALADAFTIMLVALLAAGALLLLARRAYGRDVATTLELERGSPDGAGRR
jgi:predicted MFS family arabinose efflux permease